MRKFFVDTFFLIALIDPQDSWHNQVKQFLIQIQPDELITTDEVLAETLTFFSKAGSYARIEAVTFVETILDSASILVEPQTHQSFCLGLRLYKQRADKGYSMADCTSMNTMKRLGITEVLSRDKHFTQEGFTVLFSSNR